MAVALDPHSGNDSGIYDYFEGTLQGATPVANRFAIGCAGQGLRIRTSCVVQHEGDNVLVR